ncbi:type VI secretion system accessory protein TagJ [Rhizobium halophytocola]|uniref:Type VI secretion system protein ImpE n=1 Tax=Rhizobium halophytocola TaxID=735519 RepID=A0ABS4E3H9_9HYPH|nr:type VI secretion system accessory protein TagJ [Rhizobium halophytocola]MBP1852482.1 type VI secretion system protein ImpE [Rhizobium halophytocola]
MTAEELLRQGDLDGTLSAVQDSVRKTPEDPRLRVFLFQLLCVLGQWQRAIGQLKTCVTLDPEANAMAQMYRTAIICEIYRDKVFHGEKQPLIFGEPENWVAWMIEALKLQATGAQNAAEALRAQAFDAAPAISGTLNGTPFAWVADADPRLGPMLEVIVNGRYFWAPFSAISRVVVEPPRDLRDRVWMPATVTWSNGGDAVVLIPTRYAGTSDAPDNDLKLARKTDWIGEEDRVSAGLGQRLLATDETDCALMDLRVLSIDGLPAADRPTSAAVSDHG